MTLSGRKLYEARLRSGMTQTDVAFGLRDRGHSKASLLSVGRWERGENTPHANMIPDLAAVLGVTIESLYERSESGDEDEEEEAALRRLAKSAFDRQQDDLAMELLDRVRRIKSKRTEEVA